MTTDFPLLVPVGVEALVVNSSDRRATKWSVSRRMFSGAGDLLPIEPPPFATGNDRPSLGVTLSWILPDALTVGRWHDHDGERELRYPFVPDRWLVVRRASTSDGVAIEPRAWVVESDHVGLDGTNPIPRADGGIEYIGRKFDLGHRPTTSSSRTLSLTALGPTAQGADGRDIATDVDPAFAATVANVENVFALHDDLTHEEGHFDDAAVLSYMVIGWYADPQAADPMVNQRRLGRTLRDAWSARGSTPITVDEWRTVMETLRWSVGDDHDLARAQIDAVGDRETAGTAVPSRTIFHGTVHSVRWTGRHRGAPQKFTAGTESAFAGTAIRDRAGWRNPAYDPTDVDQGDFPDVAAGLDRNDPAAQREPGSAVRGSGRANFPHVAVGTSTTDALSALVEYLLGYEDGGADPSDVAALFEALEHDLVGIYDTPAGADELRRRMQQDGFVPSAGGTRWDVVLRRPGDASGNTSSPDEPRTAPEGVQLLADLDAQDPTLGLVTKLTALNDAQRDLHRAEAALRSSRYDLYALWWKTERRRAGTVVDDAAPTSDERQRLRNEAVREFQRLRDEAATDVRTATTRRGNAADDADAARVDLEPLLGSDAARTALAKVLHGEEASTGDLAEWLELVDAPAARFYAPADPVVVISGGRSSPKHGGDGRFSDDGTLLVRFGGAGDDAPGQTLRFGDTAAGIDSSTFVDEILPGLLPNDDLPAITRDLLTEFVLLDGSAMPALASARGDLWRDPTDELHSVAAVTADAGFTGVRPSPVGVERWRQPWRPLHLCWRATWYPTEYPGDWSFDGDDLRWIGTGSFDHAKAMTLQGRSLLATAPTGALQDALDAIYERIVEAPADPDESEADRIAEHAELRAKLDQARQRLADADLLAQALTGFHDQLVQRDATQYYDPPDEPPGEGINSLLGDLGRAAPMPYDDGPDGAPRFFPIRGGHARLRRLWIVDAFGQVFDVFHERGQTDASFVPLRGRGLRTVGLTQRSDTQMLQFPPRLVQPSRLDFRFDTSGSGAVRGWLLPNHLDASLQLYDHDGNSLGSLIAWHGNLVRWQPEPGRLDPAASISAEVTRIKDRLDGKPVADLSGFLDAIDRTLRTTDPLGQRGDNLSVLVGRPVAVVAATFAVELDGPALTDQSWGAASTPDDGGVSDLSIQLRLGLPTSRDDGTLGWFESGDSRFHSVLTTPTLVQNDYVVGAGAGSGPTVPVGTVEQPADPLALTMLVDPRGSINAATGFLPHKSLRLPRGFVDAALARMDATFRVGPILSGRQVRMPLPADISSGWSWIDKTGVNLAIDERDGQWNVAEVESAAIAAHLTSAPTRIREGWLRLAQIVDDDSNDTNDTTADNGGQP